MRWMCATLLALAGASTASGQVLWAGLAAGTSWTWQAPTAPDQNFLHSSNGAPSAFLAFPLDEDTLVRLQFLISGGLGSYGLELQAQHPPAAVEERKFGWYLGVGEWFQLTQRWRVTAEVKMHRSQNLGNPIVVAATAGLAFAF